MITVRPGAERGAFDHGWLETRHTFSFGAYHDPAHSGFRTLRVINEDVVAPGTGFAAHPHRDMEILTYLVDGTLTHSDSTGREETIVPGEVQCMTAGRGIVHSEMNRSPDRPVHLLQIWIEPEATGLDPGYGQRTFDEDDRRGRLTAIASRDGRDGSLVLHQDASIHAGVLGDGDRVTHALAPGRAGWVQVVRGSVRIEGETGTRAVVAGDGAAIEDESEVVLTAAGDAEVLLFDLA